MERSPAETTETFCLLFSHEPPDIPNSVLELFLDKQFRVFDDEKFYLTLKKLNSYNICLAHCKS